MPEPLDHTDDPLPEDEDAQVAERVDDDDDTNTEDDDVAAEDTTDDVDLGE